MFGIRILSSINKLIVSRGLSNLKGLSKLKVQPVRNVKWKQNISNLMNLSSRHHLMNGSPFKEAPSNRNT